MTKIARATQKVFGDDVVAQDQHCVFGSLKAGTASYSKDPATIQSLAAWGLGWKGATVNNQAPVLQDLNALCYLLTRQIAYGFQMGVPEWDSGTEYHQYSVCQSSGILYISLIDSNLAQSLSDTSKWKPWLTWVREGTAEAPRGYSAKTASFTIANSDATLFVMTVASSPIVATLPTTCKQGYRVRFVVSGATETNNFTTSPAIAQAQINADGFVELIALQDNPTLAAHWQIVDNNVNFGANPLGSVIAIGNVAAWTLPSSGAVKNGYALCNGQTFASLPAGSYHSAFSGALPTINDSRFLMGSTAVGSTGGQNSTTLAVANIPQMSGAFTSGAQSADHSHTFSGTTAGMNANVTHSHTTTANVTSGSAQQITAGAAPSHFGFNGGALGNGTSSTNTDHAHTYSGTTSGVSVGHTHSTTVTLGTASPTALENRPTYFSVVYVMRVK